jgi:hypothetical protein
MKEPLCLSLILKFWESQKLWLSWFYDLIMNVNIVKVSQVCNETDAQLIISKYKKNTMKKKRKASYKDKKISALVLKS